MAGPSSGEPEFFGTAAALTAFIFSVGLLVSIPMKKMASSLFNNGSEGVSSRPFNETAIALAFNFGGVALCGLFSTLTTKLQYWVLLHFLAACFFGVMWQFFFYVGLIAAYRVKQGRKGRVKLCLTLLPMWYFGKQAVNYLLFCRQAALWSIRGVGWST